PEGSAGQGRQHHGGPWPRRGGAGCLGRHTPGTQLRGEGTAGRDHHGLRYLPLRGAMVRAAARPPSATPILTPWQSRTIQEIEVPVSVLCAALALQLSPRRKGNSSGFPG